ncbi:ATP-dependent helicase [Arenicella chitinivorans]|uniref:ATP-dependent helicase n=1 Tax=Arenicella chitinivorans TaxID=1329800 RepID=A0A918VL29_9GAMM|nr:PD-(D/E)XK nuclease family protein [Arenicella chitinivorans]GHA10238.1 ATP-dependent helicase [Arenicella chitinivorans]
MNTPWQNTLDSATAVLVPTRSLATSLHENLARQRIALGQRVWEAPNILVWSDYLKQLWRLNRQLLAKKTGALTLISAQQSALIWTQVIEASRREEHSLTLLNVQQTAKAVQRSWRLMHDWLITPQTLRLDHVADTTQFLAWLDDYRQRLKQRGLIDEPMVLAALHETQFKPVFQHLVWESYDLITDAQKQHVNHLTQQGVTVSYSRPHRTTVDAHYKRFIDSRHELVWALRFAREKIEADGDTLISIVVPDLQHRQAEVEELARRVFYPAMSPLQVQQNHNVYRFSLGRSLQQWPAIDAAVSAIALLRNKTSTTELSYLLRNQFFSALHTYQPQCRVFEAWLRQRRVHGLLLDNLPALLSEFTQAYQRTNRTDLSFDGLIAFIKNLVEARQALHDRLQGVRQEEGYAALKFSDWVTVLSDWLTLWGWQTCGGSQSMNSVQYQLSQRWHDLMQELAGFATVQQTAGLNRVVELLQQMVRNTIFLPKSSAAPIVISGVLEAVGRQVDLCLLTGMHQDYPPQPQSDAFVPSRVLAATGHPEGGTRHGFEHMSEVIDNLLACARRYIVSFAQLDRDADVLRQSAAKFRHQAFEDQTVDFRPTSLDACAESSVLESHTDILGQCWPDGQSPRGGSRIFEYQSQCPFRSYATHRLGLRSDEEAEFGLDNLDRGSVVHYLMELFWAQLKTQKRLTQLSPTERDTLIADIVARAIEAPELNLSWEKRTLLRHEVARLRTLLRDWLAQEEARPEPFTVVAVEQRGRAEVAGIEFEYIVDRIDATDDGRTVIIDYKTGMVDRKGWQGDRLRSPQMPLYALARDQQSVTPVAGIAFAQVKQGDHKYVEFSEHGIFRAAKKVQMDLAEEWQRARADWPVLFSDLAAAFLSGQAVVDPIDNNVCNYCDLQAFCRVSQLRLASTQSEERGDDS